MNFSIKKAERLSRGELLLRSFFGWLYIGIPHGFVLFFLGLWGAILGFISWWIILFTGRYPESFFEYQVKLIRWRTRLSARLYNLTDGYPAFGLDSTDEAITVEIPYPEHPSRGLLLLKAFFGWLYVLIPHGFVLAILSFALVIVLFLGWWMILFTGTLPQNFHDFTVGVLRWNQRVVNYIGNLTDEYPPFSLD
jgi:hypothetical protein